MSEQAQAPAQAPENERKPKRTMYNINESKKKLRSHIVAYNATDIPKACMISKNRKHIIENLYVLAIVQHNEGNKAIKTITLDKKVDEKTVKYTTLAITTKIQSLATDLQCVRQTITNCLKVLTGEVAHELNSLNKRTGEAGERPDIAAPNVLELFKTDCYGLLYLLNPDFLVPLASENKEEKE